MLQTEHLFLRNLRPSDADTMFGYRNASECRQYQRYGDTGKEALEKFVQVYSQCIFLSQEPEQHYAILRSADCKMIGDLSIFFTQKDACFTLGITIAPLFQKQGYAYELLKEVTAQLRHSAPTMDIVALIEKENLPSLALFQKLGFVEECYAESIQSYVYVIYA